MKTVPSARLIPATRTAWRDKSALRVLMDFYASDDGYDQEESEVELMVQLSGIVGGGVLATEGQ